MTQAFKCHGSTRHTGLSWGIQGSANGSKGNIDSSLWWNTSTMPLRTDTVRPWSMMKISRTRLDLNDYDWTFQLTASIHDFIYRWLSNSWVILHAAASGAAVTSLGTCTYKVPNSPSLRTLLLDSSIFMEIIRFDTIQSEKTATEARQDCVCELWCQKFHPPYQLLYTVSWGCKHVTRILESAWTCSTNHTLFPLSLGQWLFFKPWN